MLMPVLMVEGNRKINMKALNHAIKYYNVDKIVINDQEFLDTDYVEHEKVEYIGHHKERQGFVKARNQLLEWFYESEYDWAVWLDGNGRISKTTLNDFDTVVGALKVGDIGVDAITSTLGNWISGLRIEAKKMPDHMKVVRLLPNRVEIQSHMHGLFMRNFKKYYDISPVIHRDCDPRKGLSEDVYFIELLSELFEIYICPTIVVTKPSPEASTWLTNSRKVVGYPTTAMKEIKTMVARELRGSPKFRKDGKTIVLERNRYHIEKLKPYRPKIRKEKGVLIK